MPKTAGNMKLSGSTGRLHFETANETLKAIERACESGSEEELNALFAGINGDSRMTLRQLMSGSVLEDPEWDKMQEELFTLNGDAFNIEEKIAWNGWADISEYTGKEEAEARVTLEERESPDLVAAIDGAFDRGNTVYVLKCSGADFLLEKDEEGYAALCFLYENVKPALLFDSQWEANCTAVVNACEKYREMHDGNVPANLSDIDSFISGGLESISGPDGASYNLSNGSFVSEYPGYAGNDPRYENGKFAYTVIAAGAFSVSEDKKVEFSKGLLYYDGKGFRFESSQTEFTMKWDRCHINHFYWSDDKYIAIAEYYNDPESTFADIFFANNTKTSPNRDFEVDGERGVWRALSTDEWEYLLSERPDAAEKKGFVTIRLGADVIKGIMLLPDEFQDPEKNRGNEAFKPSSIIGYDANIYDTEGWNAMERAGAVFIPAAGGRFNNSISDMGEGGNCWSSSIGDYYADYAGDISFHSENLDVSDAARDYGASVRLVKDVRR